MKDRLHTILKFSSSLRQTPFIEENQIYADKHLHMFDGSLSPKFKFEVAKQGEGLLNINLIFFTSNLLTKKEIEKSSLVLNSSGYNHAIKIYKRVKKTKFGSAVKVMC